MALFEAALAAQAGVWGGGGNLIFPLTADLTERELFWEIADRFDADGFVTYMPTWADVEEFAPKDYAAEMEPLRHDVQARHGAEVATRAVEDHRGDTALFVTPTSAQLDLIRRRLAPLHRTDLSWMPDGFNGSTPVSWPFTDVTECRDLPAPITNLLASPGAARKLLLTAASGRITSGLRARLDGRNTIVSDVPIRHKYEWAELVVRQRPRAPGYVDPWFFSGQGLGPYRQGGWRREPAAVVVGDGPWDFALFYALKRFTGMAWWLPSWMRRDAAYALQLGAALNVDARSEDRPIVVVSATSQKTRDLIARDIASVIGCRLTITPADWREALPDEPLRLYERDNAGRHDSIQLLGGETLELDTPLPKRVGTTTPSNMRWVAEIQCRDWTPIRNPLLARELLRGMYVDESLVRTTRDGVAYFPIRSLYFTADSLENIVVRPRLRPLSLLDQIAALLAPDGWTCELSDKGIYALESIRLFGGFHELCSALGDQEVRAIIDAYRDRTAPGRTLSSDSRRYLTWNSFQRVLSREDIGDTIDPLLTSGVLVRGLVLKCGRCRQEAWHHISGVGDTFTCERCGLHQRADRQSWLGSDEPVWSYRMAEVLYQLLDHDGELPLLTVRHVFKDSRRPRGQSYELDLTDASGETREVDIFCSDGYRLWVGEAKKNGRFEPARLEFIAELAKLIDAYGVLLTTSKASWPPASKQQAESALVGSWPRLLMPSGVRTTP